MNPNAPAGGIRLSNVVSPYAREEEIRFLEQLGIHYAYTWCDRLAERYDDMARLRDELSKHGVTLNNMGDYKVCKSASIHLGTPERDRLGGDESERLLPKARNDDASRRAHPFLGIRLESVESDPVCDSKLLRERLQLRLHVARSDDVERARRLHARHSREEELHALPADELPGEEEVDGMTGIS